MYSDHTTKVCTRCGEAKPLEEYHRRSDRADGRCNHCKACKSECRRAWYVDYRERRAETSRAYYVANRERMDEYNRAWKKANPEKVAAKYARSRAKYPNRIKARKAVHRAVVRGEFPAANTMVCDYCQEALADHWHHHKGYSPEYQLDVRAACIDCHTQQHA